jgi:hypothetical protein
MIFRKSVLLTFLTVVAFLFLMAMSWITYGGADGESQDYRQKDLGQKSIAALGKIFSWANSLTDLSLSQNVNRVNTVREQVFIQGAAQSGWDWLNGRKSINEIIGELGGAGTNISADFSSVGEAEDFNNFLKDWQAESSMANIKEISWENIISNFFHAWERVRGIYQEFTVIY